MLKTKNLIVFLAAALMLTAGCKSTDSQKAAEPKKDAKTAAVKTETKAGKDAKDVKDAKKTEVKKDVKADAKAPKGAKADAKTKKAAEPKKDAKAEKPEIGPDKNHATNYERNDAKYPKKSFIGLAFCTPIQFPSEDIEVSGFRFAVICARNEAANGIDCGFVCLSGTGGTTGLQAGVFLNKTSGPMCGLSLSLINIAETEMNGVQIGGYNEAGSNSLNNGTLNFETSRGFQMGAANIANSVFKGLQLGLFNISNSVFKGVQIGGLNLYEPPSDVFDDFQTKEFNEEKKKRSCLQFGILNFNPDGIFPVTILVNF